jgi:Tol biopolymer transport system component
VPWIWETSVDGAEPRPLWPGRGGEWTADGRYFVFQRVGDPSGRLDLYAVREGRWGAVSHGTPTRLTFGPLSFEAVRSSSDKRRLFAWGVMRRGELARYDSSERRFVPHLGGASVLFVDASRDGEWLAWSTWPEGVLWRGRSDGSERLQLTRPGLWAGPARWSPDGKWIAFAGSSAPDGPLTVSLVRAVGGEVRVLAEPEPGLDLWDVCWLSDGRSLVFSHFQASRPGLLRVDVRTGEVSPIPGAEDFQYPKCSPRGDVFAMKRLREPGPNPYRLYSPDLGTWKDLGPVRSAAWATFTPDGKALVGLNTEVLRVERFSFDTRRAETLIDLRGHSLAFGGAAPWMGLAPDGSPLVLQDRSTSDVYALDWEAP